MQKKSFKLELIKNKTIFSVISIGLAIVNVLIAVQRPIEALSPEQNNDSSSADSSLPIYRLGPGDRLALRVFQFEGLNADINVLPDGTINVPRIGAINVLGMSIEQAKTEITRSLENILRRPIIYLDLIATRPIRIK